MSSKSSFDFDFKNAIYGKFTSSVPDYFVVVATRKRAIRLLRAASGDTGKWAYKNTDPIPT